MRTIAIEIIAALLLTACGARDRMAVPPEPDYGADSLWYAVNRDAPADLFYICSTETLDYQDAATGAVMHYANAAFPSQCPAMTAEMKGVDRRLGGDLNYYAPYYRQSTMETFKDDETVMARVSLPAHDCKRAFEEYLARMNGGRPFVLAGFSQGAQMALELLKTMPEAVRERMIATYLIGWRVTREELERHPAIRPATGPDDIGVTICYNSVRSPEDAFHPVSDGNAVAINPVNWRTDATPATLSDSLTVVLDNASKLLLVSGYSRTDHAMPPYWNGGNYHTFEIRWYSDCLKENIALRTNKYLNGVSKQANQL